LTQSYRHAELQSMHKIPFSYSMITYVCFSSMLFVSIEGTTIMSGYTVFPGVL
jgi:hypothetical protein